jgi:uncharacterized membrane protein
MKEEKIAYLEFIQAIVTRMASNSFMLKGWSVSLISGLYAISLFSGSKYLIFLPAIPVLTFWGLDAYFLRQERLYRKLYEYTRKGLIEKNKDIDLFSMDTSPFNDEVHSWFCVLFSKTLRWFHGVLFVLVLIIGIYVFFFKTT